jgi:RNA polymerase sigma-70 factor (ECF subfamily)
MVEAQGHPALGPPLDEASFLALLQPHLATALRLAHALLRRPSEAEDMVQEASLKAWAKRHTFRLGGNFKAWYLTIVANECRQALRSEWWHSVFFPFGERRSAQQPEDKVVADDEVRRALIRLSYDHRLAIVLRFYLDLSFEEIASMLQISPQTARTRIHRALARLRPIFNVQEVPGND